MVCFIVINLVGSDIYCQEVMIVLLLAVSFIFEDQGVGMIVFIDVFFNDFIVWLWDFGDGNSSIV